MLKKQLKNLTKQWLTQHDPTIKFKRSPKYKARRKMILDRTKAFKQKKSQTRFLSRHKGLIK